MDCPHCGKPVLDDALVKPRTRLWTVLTKHGRAMHRGDLAFQVYGENTPATRNRVAQIVFQMNLRETRIVSSAKGYSVAKRAA